MDPDVAQQYLNGYQQGREDAYRAVLASGDPDAFILLTTAASIARGEKPATLQVRDKDAT